MGSRLRLGCALSVVAFSVAGGGQALASAGLTLTSVGAKEKGMGGAGIALARDAVAPINNPAATVFISDQFSIGSTILTSNAEFWVDGAGTGPFPLAEGEHDAKERFFAVPYASVAKRLDERWSAAFSAYGLFGLGVTYPDHARPGCPPGLPGTGPLCAGETQIDTSALFISPTIAYRVMPQFSVGVSPALVFSRIEVAGLAALEAFGASSDPGHVSNKGPDEAFGYAVKFGAHYEGERLSLGLAYQTEAKMGRYSRYRGLFAEGGNVDLPAVFTAGFGLKLGGDVTLAGDITRVFYADVPSLANRFINPLVPGNPKLGEGDATGFGWKDQWVYHLGAEQRLDAAWTVRAGYAYADDMYRGDQALLNALAPAVMKHTITGGFTLTLGDGVSVDAALSWAPADEYRGSNALSPDQGVTAKHEITELGLALNYAW